MRPIYHLSAFRRGYVEYAEAGMGGDFDLYKRLVHEVTETFQGLSTGW
jgi:hypothetical protein